MLKSKVLNITFLLKSKVLNITFLLKSKVLNITFWHPGGFEKSPARRPGEGLFKSGGGSNPAGRQVELKTNH